MSLSSRPQRSRRHRRPAGGRRSDHRPWPHGPRPRRCSGPPRRTPTPAVDPGPGHGGIGAPAQVRRRRDDRAVMGARLAPATDSLWRQQALPAQQPQDPLAADPHAMLASQPGPDLAVALAGERRGGQDPADQPHELVIADRGRRSRPERHPSPATPGIHRGAGRAQHPAHHRHRQPVFHGYLGRFAGGIWTPLFSAAARRISFSMVSRPTLRSACRRARSSPDRSGRWPSGLPYRSPGSRPARPPADAPPPQAPATAPPTARHAVAGILAGLQKLSRRPKETLTPPSSITADAAWHRFSRFLNLTSRCPAPGLLRSLTMTRSAYPCDW